MLTAPPDNQDPEDPFPSAGSHFGDPQDEPTAPPGLAWSWEIDFGELVEALGGTLEDGGARADGYAGDEGQEAALDAEQKKYNVGKSTTFIVLQLQIKLTQARSSEIGAVVGYNQALAQLAHEEGNTLERRQIDFKVK